MIKQFFLEEVVQFALVSGGGDSINFGRSDDMGPRVEGYVDRW
jgi:hypothetical protein